MTAPRVLVLATGGTIAGQADSATAVNYTSGQVPVGELLSMLEQAGMPANVTAEQVANVGSQDMDAAIWRTLHDRIRTAFISDAADAVIITHGTDTVEETGFLLDLLLPPGRAIVLVSAMRPANVIGSDGPRNLANGFRAALDPASRGRGVLVVLGDSIFAARDVYKASTRGTEAFRAFPGGAIGAVSPATLRYHAPPDDAPWRGRYAFPRNGAFPRVPILYAHAGMDKGVTEAVLRSGVAGVVSAGVGHGNIPRPMLEALARAAAAGMPILRASRVQEGTVTRNLEVDDDRLGFLSAGFLSPQKSRILLQLLLANGVDYPAARQAAFDLF